jgi:predicted transcriptional regulator
MTLKELVDCIDGVVVNGQDRLAEKFDGVYVSDLLSDVMGHAQEGNVWLTIQTHNNVVAVALLLNLAAIVFTAGNAPDGDTIEKGQEEGVVLISTKLSTFEAAGRIYQKLQ